MTASVLIIPLASSDLWQVLDLRSNPHLQSWAVGNTIINASRSRWDSSGRCLGSPLGIGGGARSSGRTSVEGRVRIWSGCPQGRCFRHVLLGGGLTADPEPAGQIMSLLPWEHFGVPPGRAGGGGWGEGGQVISQPGAGLAVENGWITWPERRRRGRGLNPGEPHRSERQWVIPESVVFDSFNVNSAMTEFIRTEPNTMPSICSTVTARTSCGSWFSLLTVSQAEIE